MFESLSSRLGQIFGRLKRRATLAAVDVNEVMREVRIALLEADVALPVVKDFIARVRAGAVGQEVIRSVTPGQMVVKIVHDALVEVLGTTGVGLDLARSPPVAVLVVGLQGSGKTTTSAKMGLYLKIQERRRVLMVSLDVYRPAAQEQLAVLGRQAGIATLSIIHGQTPVAIARRAMDEGRNGGFDVIILDTAGRLHIDPVLMAEVTAVRNAIAPAEILLVADAMTGQDAVNLARTFNEQLHLTGIVLTRVDGDARGGAALSMRAVTGKPIKLLGTGEKLEALESFHPDRLARRILGMGDVISLVEKAAATIRREEAEEIALKMLEGRFDLNDLLAQLRQVRKMGDLKDLFCLLPGSDKLKRKVSDAHVNEKLLIHQEAIILSMTPAERCHPEIIKASRKRRIALGCGLTVQEVNKLLKWYQQVAQMTKGMRKMKQKGQLERLLSGVGWPPSLPMGTPGQHLTSSAPPRRGRK
ncbi:Signal recognition particle, subunit Ffh SRP54 (TC 3.A.5.1.1) [invertebrate metagenome]|uniref:signal-recognition-particle GTPase n=1 Tax=invertebrate metagenome TaxID=1711999 RepID=A0A484H6H4_9ZZZZ